MASIYSTKLLSVVMNTPGPNQTFIVPPGFTCVLRDVDIFTQAGVSAGSLGLYDLFTDTTFVMFTPANVGGPTQFTWRGRQVFPYVAGDLNGFGFYGNSSTNTYQIQCSGYLLSQP